MTNIGTTYINKSSNWWLYVEDAMLIWSLIHVDGIITICIELTLGLFWHNLHFFDMHSMDKILYNRKGEGKGGWWSYGCGKKKLFINWIPTLNGWRNEHNLSLVQEHRWKKTLITGFVDEIHHHSLCFCPPPSPSITTKRANKVKNLWE